MKISSYKCCIITEGIDVDKSSNSKECIICPYYFFNHEFKFQGSVCNGFHDLAIFCLNATDIAIIAVKCVNYHCIIYDISSSEAIHLLEIMCMKMVGIYKNAYQY